MQNRRLPTRSYKLSLRVTPHSAFCRSPPRGKGKLFPATSTSNTMHSKKPSPLQRTLARTMESSVTTTCNNHDSAVRTTNPLMSFPHHLSISQVLLLAARSPQLRKPRCWIGCRMLSARLRLYFVGCASSRAQVSWCFRNDRRMLLRPLGRILVDNDRSPRHVRY